MFSVSGTNVPVPTFGPTGFILPAESAILAGRLEDISQAFGGHLSQNLETPQSQLASSDTAIIGNANATFLLFTNLVDPALSSGWMQDAIGHIYFLTRNLAQPTVLQVLCTGGALVAIPVNAIIQDQFGNLLLSTARGTFPAGGGRITLPFAYVNTGPTPIPATAAVSIYQSIPGLDAVSVVSGVLGNVVKSPAAFEARRQATVEGNSLGSIGSIIAAVARSSP